MFRKDLMRRLETIFETPITLDAPSDDYEQDKIFVEITYARPRISNANGGREIARVVGSLIMFSQGDRLTYGFFSKQIEKSAGAVRAPLFFYDIDVDDPASPARLMNIHERRVSFVFLYDSQFDPDKGSLTELDLSVNFGE